MLFNEQSSRPCAEGVGVHAHHGGHPICDPNLIGRGGWARSIPINFQLLNQRMGIHIPTSTSPPPPPPTSSSSSFSIDHQLLNLSYSYLDDHVDHLHEDDEGDGDDDEDKDVGILITLPYSLHEFGLSPPPLPQPASPSSSSSDPPFSDIERVFGNGNGLWYGGRVHDFSSWPGLSLNPRLWDVSAIKERLKECILGRRPTYAVGHPRPSRDKRGNYSYSSSSSSSSSSSEPKEGNPKRIVWKIEKKVDGWPIFDENDTAFEHRFSALSLAAGLRMGFLPSLIFSHTGGQQSAYSLNGIQRPWETGQEEE